MDNLPNRLSQTPAFLARHAHLIALALFAIIGVAILDDYGITPDDEAQHRIGYAAFNYITGNADELTGYIFEHDIYYGIAVEAPLVAVERLLGLEDTRAIYLSRHLLTHLLFLAAGFFAWLLAYRMFGSRLVALLAMSLFLLHPRIYAHSFFNSKDPTFLSAFMIALYLTHRAFRRDAVWAFALCGAGVALLANIRVMGAMLLPAVLGMLALDGFHAMKRGGGWVKLVITNSAAFSAAFAAALYATRPILWANPLELINELRVLSAHPHITANLFRGEWVWSRDLPWDYIPVWMLITAPPAALILAALGIAAAARLCAADWSGMLANSTARFGLLAAACLILPVIAAAALNSTMYHGWRHMYFLWAPACVLGAFGLSWLSEIPRPRLRVVALSLAALGIALAAVQTIRLHPYQADYFNPLADKSGLAERWDLDYWSVSRKQALERALSMQPAGRVFVNSCDFSAHGLHRNLKIIPREDRMRTVVNYFYPDFCIDRTVENPVWSAGVHGAAIISLADNRETARREYSDAYAAAKSREPDFKGYFTASVDDDLVILTKEPCAETDIRGTFAISARPVHPDETAGYMRDDGFDGASFRFWDYGRILGGACVMARRLPAYPIESLKAAYRPPNDSRELWSADIPVNNHIKAYESAMESEPVVRSGFDVYADGGRLIYVKPQCSKSDAPGSFLLSVHPVDASDLPRAARDAGLDHQSLNFGFYGYGALFDGKCVIIRNLPDYRISHIEAGQWIPGGDGLWSARIIFEGYYDRFRRALSALSGATPAASAGGFDIYADDGTLTYVKSPCAESDARGRFGLSAYPVDPNDLPQSARDDGLDHEPLNFDFHRNGAIFDGNCVAIRDLPDYPISHLETGQWIPGEGGLWSVRIPFAGYEDRFRRALSAVSGDNPAANAGGFDIYMDGGTLTYVKSPCSEDDARGRFALSIYPIDQTDLPQNARDTGMDHESLNFDFTERGAIIDGDCVIIRNLPDYPISRIETGQWIPGEGGLWSAEIEVSGQ